MPDSYSYDDEEEQKKQAAGGAPAPSQPTTFSQMQAAGYARPPEASQQTFTSGGMMNSTGMGTMEPIPPASQFTQETRPPKGDFPTAPPPLPGGPWQPPGATNPFTPQVPGWAAGLGDTLYGQWNQPNAFNFQNYNVQTPQAFMPQGINFQRQQQATPYAGNIPGFHAQYNAIQAPANERTGQFSPGANPLDMQLQRALMGAVQNPSAYGSDVVGQTYDMLNRRLGQGYDAERQRINEDMARRGLYNSSIAGGRLGDLATNQAYAQQDLATNLLRDQAQTYGQDRTSALGQAMGYSGQTFGNQLAGFQANQSATGQNFQQELATRAFQGDQQAMQVLNALQQSTFGRESQAQQFGQNLQQQQFASNEQDRMLNALLGVSGFNQQAGQQGYQNQLSSQGFQQGLEAQRFGQAQSGYQTNANQQQQALQNLLGYGQQGFSNQMETARFNQAQDAQLVSLLLGLLGGTARG